PGVMGCSFLISAAWRLLIKPRANRNEKRMMNEGAENGLKLIILSPQLLVTDLNRSLKMGITDENKNLPIWGFEAIDL
ncbi:MAG: hypothetical protein OJI67_08680, partial [Prosthecobacter sp.]|nr:hypothetical protein [Prosthecobacter sp.]